MATLYMSIMLLLVFFLFRYYPVTGIQDIKWEQIDTEKVTIIDVRDFNESYKSLIPGAVNIPIAYLKRSIKELPLNEVHLITANNLEKNIGVRVLRRNGYRVCSYSLLPSNQSLTNEKGIEVETSFS